MSCDVQVDGGLPVPPVPQRRSVAAVKEKEKEGVREGGRKRVEKEVEFERLNRRKKMREMIV